ncbi:hypothetical protein ACEQPO_23925 [Bacillus sp. SL00103]
MEYSNQLSQLDMMLDDFYESTNNSSLYDQKKRISSPSLSIKGGKLGYVKNKCGIQNDDVSTFIDEMQKFSDGYAEYISTQQASMEQELNAISESADNVASKWLIKRCSVYSRPCRQFNCCQCAGFELVKKCFDFQNMSSLTDRQKGWQIIRITLKRV